MYTSQLEDYPLQYANRSALEILMHLKQTYGLINPTEDKNDNDYTPGLYLPSAWTPPLAPTHIENWISAFEGKLNDYFEQRRPKRSDNLTFFQRRSLKKLQADTSLHVCDTDKNLGPVVIDKRVYLKQIYEEHLSVSTYIRLNEK
jgi:hypothetical protein